MSSLADEIKKLFALQQIGALSPEEFKAAKDSLIAHYTHRPEGAEQTGNAPAPATAASAPPETNNNNNNKNNNNNSNTRLASTPWTTTTAPVEHVDPHLLEVDEEREAREGPPPGGHARDQQDDAASDTGSCLSDGYEEEWSHSFPHIEVRPWLHHADHHFDDDLPSPSTTTTSTSSSSAPPPPPELGRPSLRLLALEHLRRVFTNLLAHPTAPKYRKLRCSNATLQRTVFAVVGAEALLQSCGFQREREAGPDGTDEVVYLYRGAAAPPPPPPPTTTPSAAEDAAGAERPPALLEEALSAVFYLKRCEEARQYRLLKVRTLRKWLRVEVGLEQAQAYLRDTPAPPADAVQHPLQPYLVELYTTDEAGDGLATSLRHLRQLRALLRPPCAKLDLRRWAPFTALLRQHGGLEAAVVVGGWALQQPAAEAAWELVAPPPGAVPEEGRLQAVLAAVEAAVLDTQATRSQRERSAAEAAARADRRRALRQVQRRHEVAARQEEEAQRARHARLRLEEFDSDDDDEEGEAEARRQRQQGEEGRRRVPLSEAIAYLLGKREEV